VRLHSGAAPHAFDLTPTPSHYFGLQPAACRPGHAAACAASPARLRRQRLQDGNVIAHTSLHVSQYSRSKAFFIAALAPLGYHNNMEEGEAAGFNDGTNTDFWISRVASAVTPSHVAFQVRDRRQVEAFHDAALAAGGRNNGDPGYRNYSPGYYAAFVLDPDGNNVEAVWYDPAKST
jgi:catechol 2,3-dioxygenase-like lactoylglutathione lyase family enzyme